MALCIVLSILLLTGSLLITSRIVPGVRLEDTRSALAAALVLGALWMTLGQVLLWLTMPLRFLHFGLAGVFIEALLLNLTTRFVRGLEIRGFGATMLAAVSMTLLWRLGSWLIL